jgi:4-hydroxy-tetrahydrodipicolinate synthase
VVKGVPVELKGIVPPVVTPIDVAGSVDGGSLNRLVEYLLAGGVHGLFVLGSSGEAASLDAGERASVVRTVVRAAAGRVPVLVGVIDTSTRRVFEYVEMAKTLGADAVVALATYYYRTNQAEMLDLFRTIARRSSLPVVAYNLPQIVGVSMEAATVAQLAGEGTIRGIKDSSPDLSVTREMVLAVRDIVGFSVMTGVELAVDVAVAMGMAGAVPGLANVAPRPYVDIYDHVRGGEFNQARVIQERLIALYAIIRQGRSGQSYSAAALSGFKAGLKLLGVIATSRMHEPMQGLTTEEEQRVKAIMQQTGFL